MEPGGNAIPPPSVEEVRRIAATANPVIRNLEITYCYSRLAAAFTAYGGGGANWCTKATDGETTPQPDRSLSTRTIKAILRSKVHIPYKEIRSLIGSLWI